MSAARMGEYLDPIDYFSYLADHAVHNKVSDEELSSIAELYVYLFDKGNRDEAYLLYSAYSTRRLSKKFNQMIRELLDEEDEFVQDDNVAS